MVDLRLGIDGFPALRHAPGVGRYVRELCRALVLREDSPRLVFVDWGRGSEVLPRSRLGVHGSRVARVVRVPLPRGAARWLGGAERFGGGIDVFHQAMLATPLHVRGVRESIAISDLPPEGGGADAAAAAMLSRMALVLVFSAAAKVELVRRYGAPPERVVPVPVGADHWARESAHLDPAEPPRRRTILVLGQAGAARKTEAVLSAFASLVRGGLDLELSFVGPKGEPRERLLERIKRAGVSDRVEVAAGSASLEDEMPSRVARAGVLVHLNDAEWTPVTPLEAFAAGCPVVVSRLPAFEEALRDAARYVDAAELEGDARGLADAIAAELAADGAPARARRRALAAHYTWDENAKASIAAWKALAAGSIS